MHYVLCKTKVADYIGWREVFDSHAFTDGAAAEEGARDSGVVGAPEVWHLTDE